MTLERDIAIHLWQGPNNYKFLQPQSSPFQRSFFQSLQPCLLLSYLKLWLILLLLDTKTVLRCTFLVLLQVATCSGLLNWHPSPIQHCMVTRGESEGNWSPGPEEQAKANVQRKKQTKTNHHHPQQSVLPKVYAHETAKAWGTRGISQKGNKATFTASFMFVPPNTWITHKHPRCQKTFGVTLNRMPMSILPAQTERAHATSELVFDQNQIFLSGTSSVSITLSLFHRTWCVLANLPTGMVTHRESTTGLQQQQQQNRPVFSSHLERTQPVKVMMGTLHTWEHAGAFTTCWHSRDRSSSENFTSPASRK